MPSQYVSLQLTNLKEVLKGFQCPLSKTVKADLFVTEPVPAAYKALHDTVGEDPQLQQDMSPKLLRGSLGTSGEI